MRVLLILAVIILLMALGGWLVFNRNENSSTIEIQTDKMQEDASDAVRGAQEWVEDTAEGLDRSIETPAERRTSEQP